jgi:hypothetical protein
VAPGVATTTLAPATAALLLDVALRHVDRPVVEAEIARGTADPITSDVRGLVRALSASTALTLSGESLFLGPDRDMDRAVQVLEKLWLHALWGGQASG